MIGEVQSVIEVYYRTCNLSGHLIDLIQCLSSNQAEDYSLDLSFWFVEDETCFVFLLITNACLLSASLSCLQVYILHSENIWHYFVKHEFFPSTDMVLPKRVPRNKDTFYIS